MSRSISGKDFERAERSFCARHPATTSVISGRARLSPAISSMTEADSSAAGLMNPQVFTMMMSADAGSAEKSHPATASAPSITSVSTVFFGQPRLTAATIGALGLLLTVFPFGINPPGAGHNRQSAF